MPQLDIQTFISQYVWFFLGNFVVIYLVVYTLLVPNLHTRSYLINSLVGNTDSSQTVPASQVNNTNRVSSFNLAVSSVSIAPIEVSLTSPLCLKEIHSKIIMINYSESTH